MTDNSDVCKNNGSADKVDSREPSGEPTSAPRSDNPEGVQASLLQFISGMTAQTLMHLGAMTNPMSGKIETDLVNAKYSIDLLGILQEKTRGNLTEEESEYLGNALYQLRMSYVQATQRQKQEPAPPDPGNETAETGADNRQEKRDQEQS